MSNFTRDSCSSIRKDRAFYLMKLEVVAIQLICGPSKLPIRNMKQIFRTTPVMSAFTGNELVMNLMKELRSEKKESLHISSQLYKHGYLYPVEQSVVSFRDDSTLYRMQAENLWPSQCNNPSNFEYSAFLEKKLLHKLKLADYEQDAYDRFRVIYLKSWAALTQKAQKAIDLEENSTKEDRSILQGEERAFWRLHRPSPGETLVMEASIQKRNLNISDTTDFQVIQGLETKIDVYKKSIRRNRVKLAHSAELIIQYADKLKCVDPFLKKNIYNHWVNDFKSPPPINPNRFQLWSTSFDLLLRDKLGRELFMLFLSSEVSSENLKFCEDVTKYKMLPTSKLGDAAEQIFSQYCGTKARSEINIDGKTFRTVSERMKNPDRYTFDPAQNYIYDLMRKDPYSRFLKSKYFTDSTRKYSMDRKSRRNSRFIPFPLNAESMNLHGHHNSFESQPSLEFHNLHKSNSMDALVESLTDPTKAALAQGTYISFEGQDCRGGKPFQRNTSGGNLLHTTLNQNDIAQVDEVDDHNNHCKLTTMSTSFQRSYPVKNSNSKVGGSFEELSLTKPVSPNIKNFPKPKISVSALQIEEGNVKKLST